MKLKLFRVVMTDHSPACLHAKIPVTHVREVQAVDLDDIYRICAEQWPNWSIQGPLAIKHVW